MSYCYMISPILSYKVCSSVSSLFPVCNCGLILYRKKEVMTRIINKLIRVFSGLSKTFGLETASEFGNTTALESLSVTKNSSRGSQTESLYIPSSSSSLIYYAAGGGLRPSRSSASSNKIRRWIGKRKTPVRNARNYHLCLSRLKNFVEILGVQVFALMQKMLLSEHL